MMHLQTVVDRVILYNSYFMLNSFEMSISHYFTFDTFMDVSSSSYINFIAILKELILTI